MLAASFATHGVIAVQFVVTFVPWLCSECHYRLWIWITEATEHLNCCLFTNSVHVLVSVEPNATYSHKCLGGMLLWLVLVTQMTHMPMHICHACIWIWVICVRRAGCIAAILAEAMHTVRRCMSELAVILTDSATEHHCTKTFRLNRQMSNASVSSAALKSCDVSQAHHVSSTQM